jgi:hypothetical protein
VGEPIVYLVSFQWLRDLGSANFGGGSEGGIFGQIARIFYSRPSEIRDSVAEMQNPSSEQGFWEFVGSIFWGSGDHESVFVLLFTTFIGWFILGSILLGLIFFIIKTKSNLLDQKEKIIYDTVISSQQKEQAGDKSARWQDITGLVKSEDPNNWKVAIMNADILLAEVLDEHGYGAATVGDQLQLAQKDNLKTLQYAWDAHKVRNKISHDAQFNLGQREAQTAISFYEKFFSEIYHM